MKLFERLDEKIISFIEKQKVFFVATSPLGEDGHINLSPKGYEDSFAIIDDKTIAWLDLGGSGIETLAHLKENGRITIMFCAFEGPANILRLFGQGEAIQFDDPRFDEMMKLFPAYEKARSIVVVKLDRIQNSCGWGVPFMEYKSKRDQLQRFTENPDKTQDDWETKWRTKNAVSIDGLPGIEEQNG